MLSIERNFWFKILVGIVYWEPFIRFQFVTNSTYSYSDEISYVLLFAWSSQTHRWTSLTIDKYFHHSRVNVNLSTMLDPDAITTGVAPTLNCPIRVKAVCVLHNKIHVVKLPSNHVDQRPLPITTSIVGDTRQSYFKFQFELYTLNQANLPDNSPKSMTNRIHRYIG